MRLGYKVMLLSALLGGFWINQAVASSSKSVEIFSLNNDVSKKGIGEKIGIITLQDSGEGLLIRPQLEGLIEGEHGFHVHEHPSCEALEHAGKVEPGLAAGQHFDPQHTHTHQGPHGAGHLGDLPVLVVNKQGQSRTAMVAPHLKLKDVTNRSLIIHEGGDNYSDQPPLGGGGPRVACGIIK